MKHDDDAMAKDPAKMTHAERRNALMRELESSTAVAKIDKVLELMRHEWFDVLGIRDMAVRRYGAAADAPPVPDLPKQGSVQTPGEGKAESRAFDGTHHTLIACYQADPDSSYQKLRYRTKENYRSLMRRIDSDHGPEFMRDIGARQLLRWHEDWTGSGVPMAHSLMVMLRTLYGFGTTFLEDAECARLSVALSKMRFKMPEVRTERLTADQATDIRKMAHKMGRPSIALAQAFQFDCMLRQRDVIGEWVPESEPGESEFKHEGKKWLRGIHWKEIDDNLILRHTTSKLGKKIEFDLRMAPMVREELAIQGRKDKGPIVVSEFSSRPWTPYEFRRWWRKVADACGVPPGIKNMDSRGAPHKRSDVHAGDGESSPALETEQEDTEPAPLTRH